MTKTMQTADSSGISLHEVQTQIAAIDHRRNLIKTEIKAMDERKAQLLITKAVMEQHIEPILPVAGS
jgi:hypothetical protein